MDEQAIRSRLDEMIAELDASVAELAGEHDNEDNQQMSDAGEAITSAERNKALLDNLADQRSQVQAAQERLAAGTYGVCTNCGKQIPEARLEARPEAALCVQCQEQLESD